MILWINKIKKIKNDWYEGMIWLYIMKKKKWIWMEWIYIIKKQKNMTI